MREPAHHSAYADDEPEGVKYSAPAKLLPSALWAATSLIEGGKETAISSLAPSLRELSSKARLKELPHDMRLLGTEMALS